MPRRRADGGLTWREQVVAAALWGLDERFPETAVWGRDIEVWLHAQPDDATKISYPTIDDILGRFEDSLWLEGLFEQFTEYTARPQRKYHRLTDAGRDAAVKAIQSLRAGGHRPSWLPIPELHPGQRKAVIHPDGFKLTPPAGDLAPLSKRKLRAVR